MLAAVRRFAAVTTVAVLLVAGSVAYASAEEVNNSPGTVVAVEDLASELWLPGAGDAKRITYWTVGSDGAPALSTGAFFVPEGNAPEGGWPVIAWAHGTSGLDDNCTPSLVGPPDPARDRQYLGTWLGQGYAVAATDYVGLGTPGIMSYLDGKLEAHNVVDSVKASRTVEKSLSNKWVVVGQSQGGGAAITTARYASEFGGPDLDYRGGVGTGVPANIELALLPAGPGFLPIAVGKGLTTYLLYILAGLRSAHPEIDIDSYLTPLGRETVDRAQTLCVLEAEEEFDGIVSGDLFSRPLNEIPNFYGLINDYMGVPFTGYDRPVFIAQGLYDTDVPAPSALSLVAQMIANGQPVTLHTYPTDHSGAMLASQADSIPFVAGLFR
ncbi:lipase [Rhodococcus sp. PAMC28707]|uniref:lipase family protein n=1 Tax=unclassified Rhodococcus (in: high G+C Gram-positive bacteria) TaxID=192944 RepID=UPI00109E31A1|nr:MULTISPECIES: lipase family protein [unclassified Rhodococcus (in: high G+C Gram-positive bacteria)]QCB50313.1 lipase [Rhodococcus sp. PAMC28705]QCB57995.1 lipase [Rhodococcus sp. PAMC28707]